MVLANPEIANLPGWVIALVAAGGIAAALSTAAGLLLVISSSISHDLLKKTFRPQITEKGRTPCCAMRRRRGDWRRWLSWDQSARFCRPSCRPRFWSGRRLALSGDPHGHIFQGHKPRRRHRWHDHRARLHHRLYRIFQITLVWRGQRREPLALRHLTRGGLAPLVW